jgi:hypothetical protein
VVGVIVVCGNGVFAVVHAQILDTSSDAQSLDRGLERRLQFPWAFFSSRESQRQVCRRIHDAEPGDETELSTLADR